MSIAWHGYGRNELGEIEWATVETKVSEMLSQAAESVEQALRQRYLHANGR